MQKQLRDGLILRSLSDGTAADWERLPQFYADTFINEYGNPEDWRLGNWTRDLMRGHPTTTPDDIFYVVDPAKDEEIVSATLLIPQTWNYGGIAIPVGRPELVGTHPDYRNRGLVRALFEVTHQRSAELGHLMQGITGIPHYYRQYGYTMAVELGFHSGMSLIEVDDLPEAETPKYTLRAAAETDIPDLIAWTQYAQRWSLLSAQRDAEQWCYELLGRDADSFWKMDYQIIVNAEGAGVGYVAMRHNRYKMVALCQAYIVGPEASYMDVFADVQRGLKAWAAAKFADLTSMVAFDCVTHPALDLLLERTGGTVKPARTYAWYLRVPDLAVFLKRVAPVLEARLEHSGAHRYSGKLEVALDGGMGVTMQWENGKLTDVIHDKMAYTKGDTRFPWLMFLNMVFGYQTCNEIAAFVPGAGASRNAGLLLETLFPKQPSWLHALA
jgi:GNAT superfamily N-acetyltransferase